ncbi:ParB N-terminal domain-containing protein [Paenibacillus sp. NPDC058174]|uniref:sigma factor n=1 Tax=Paenibacillus sp. NPDC058174 TaxID=3346366 RepID=UPI0036DF2849
MNQPVCRESTIEEIVERYAGNVRRTARKFVNVRMLYDKWLFEDLIQQGFLGLIEAYPKFDFSKGKDLFWRYAYKFVKGKMIDFTIQHYNYIRPSKKMNSLILEIKRRDLIGRSPYHISQAIGCSYRMAAEAINFLLIRRTIYLHEPATKNQWNSGDDQIIDTVPAEENQDELFQIESRSEFSEMEQKISFMLINGYSRENIIEHCNIPAIQLKKNIDEILKKCGLDNQKITNRNEELLMQISVLEEDREDRNIVENIEKKNFEWIEVELISANPSNPRKDSAVNTEQLQETLISKGWEEPVTCYKRGQYYILLAGHRRLNAAKQLGHYKIPVFVVEPPATTAEEKDRLGSLQSIQVDWTPYEIAKNIYDRWIYAGGISYAEFAKKVGLPKSKVEAKIRVYKYYLRVEIEDKLTNGMYSITMLDYILIWIKRLVQYQPDYVESMTEEFIRKQMLTKYENKCFNSQIANDRFFVCKATSKEIFSFLSDTTKTLRQSEIELTIALAEKERNNEKIYQLLDDSLEAIKNIEWNDHKEAKQLMGVMDKLIHNINAKSIELKGGL